MYSIICLLIHDRLLTFVFFLFSLLIRIKEIMIFNHMHEDHRDDIDPNNLDKDDDHCKPDIFLV